MKSFSRVQLFTTPWTVAYRRLLRPRDFPGKSTGVGFHFLLQGIFPTQGSKPDLPHCRQMLYRLSHQGKYKPIQVRGCQMFLNKEKNKPWWGKVYLRDPPLHIPWKNFFPKLRKPTVSEPENCLPFRLTDFKGNTHLLDFFNFLFCIEV